MQRHTPISIQSEPAHAPEQAQGGQDMAALGRKHFVFMLTEGFSHLMLSCVTETLILANIHSAEPLFSWSLASQDGQSATSFSGTTVLVQSDFKSAQSPDCMFVLSGDVRDETFPLALLSSLRKHRVHGGEIGGLGTGVFALAQAGLVNTCPVAMHWEMRDSFCELYPHIEIHDGIYSMERGVYTAAGGATVADFMLELIRQEHGEDLALAIADRMVLPLLRSSQAPQRVSVQARNGVRNLHLVQALDLMRNTLEDPLPPIEIAKEIGISCRQLERIFQTHVGTSPKRHYVEMRLQKARRLLIQTELSITEVTLACGFNSTSHFSKMYKAKFGYRPSKQRYWIA